MTPTHTIRVAISFSEGGAPLVDEWYQLVELKSSPELLASLTSALAREVNTVVQGFLNGIQQVLESKES